MNKKKCLSVLLASLLLPSASVMAIGFDDIKVGGTYMGVFNSISPAATRTQFDFATNLDFEFQFSDNIRGIAQLQSGPGNGSLGFVGPEAVLTDVSVEIDTEKAGTVTMGSFDLPLGKGVGNLVNNADAFSSPFLLNSLTYSALAGPVGTLNTLGLKSEKSYDNFETVTALTNGTAEDATNHGESFLYLVGIGSDALADGLYVGASYTASNDAADSSATNGTNSFATDFQAYLIDLNYEVSDALNIKTHFGTLTYDDGSAATKDDVTVVKVESTYSFNKSFVAIRFSSWTPEDDNGDNSGVSSTIASPGFLDGAVTDTSITRIQLGVGTEIEENLMARADIVQDNYDVGSDVTGVVLSLNGRF